MSEQRQRIADLEEGINSLEAYIRSCLPVVLMHSGMSWRISIRTTGKQSIASRVATIGLVLGEASTVLKEAPKRHREKDPAIESIFLPGGLEVRIKRP